MINKTIRILPTHHKLGAFQPGDIGVVVKVSAFPEMRVQVGDRTEWVQTRDMEVMQ